MKERTDSHLDPLRRALVLMEWDRRALMRDIAETHRVLKKSADQKPPKRATVPLRHKSA